jgi:hypothetical protein
MTGQSLAKNQNIFGVKIRKEMEKQNQCRM